MVKGLGCLRANNLASLTATQNLLLLWIFVLRNGFSGDELAICEKIAGPMQALSLHACNFLRVRGSEIVPLKGLLNMALAPPLYSHEVERNVLLEFDSAANCACRANGALKEPGIRSAYGASLNSNSNSEPPFPDFSCEPFMTCSRTVSIRTQSPRELLSNCSQTITNSSHVNRNLSRSPLPMFAFLSERFSFPRTRTRTLMSCAPSCAMNANSS